MKQFKIIDFWVSVILIVVFALLGVITLEGKIVYSYFIVGAWQVISMVIHAFNKWFTAKKGRRSIYHRLVLILIAVTAMLSVLAQSGEIFLMPIIALLYVFLFASPLMAIYYAYMCYQETFIKMKRPMELLK